MVKSIAEENQIKMPSFFGYMIWSAAIRAGFDRMGASLLDRARRDRRLSVSRGTKVASNLPALCEILVKLDAEFEQGPSWWADPSLTA